MRIQYRLHANEIERHAAFLRLFNEVLEPFRKRKLGSGKDNSNMGHVCGTCRFGTDPATSVLDPQNRAHEVDNLYVVDTSFFPSSAGLNPSLTVAANALRVADTCEPSAFRQLSGRSVNSSSYSAYARTASGWRSARLADRKACGAIDRVDDAHVLDRVLRRRPHRLSAQHRAGERFQLEGVRGAAREALGPLPVS